MISIQQIRIIVILLIVFPLPCQFITLFIYFTYRALACPSFMKGVRHMNQLLQSFFTRENITLFLSIVGFLGTVSGWLYYWICNRRNLKIAINDYFYAPHQCLTLHISFSNNSKRPISITDICLNKDGKKYSCSHIPVKVINEKHNSGPKITSSLDRFSLELPLNLAALSGKSGYFYFPLDSKISLSPPSNEDFVICSNHGSPIEMKFSLSESLAK